MTAEEFAGKCGKAKHFSWGWKALCPAHDDKEPSLSIRQDADKMRLKCHAGCTDEDILKAAGCTVADLFLEPRTTVHAGPRLSFDQRIEESYSYQTEEGEEHYQVCRLHSPKDFRVRHLNPLGSYEWNLNGQTHYPYRLPRILEAIRRGETIYVVEGEKDVHAVEDAGGYATCNHGGALKWRSLHSEWIKGSSRVVIVADKDPEEKKFAGQKHAEQVKASLDELGIPCQIVYAKTGKDAADHLSAGFELDDWAEYVSPFLPAPKPYRFKALTVDDLANMPEKPMLIKGLLGVKDRWMFFGRSGGGKTLTILDLLVCAASGGIWAGHFECERPLKVAYCTSEGTFGIPRRLLACLGHNGLEYADIRDNMRFFLDVPQVFQTDGERSIHNFADEIMDQGFIPDILVLDTLNKASLGSKEADNSEAALICDTLAQVGEKLGCSSGFVHHTGWENADRPRGATAYVGDMDLILRQDLPTEASDGKIHLFKGKDIAPFEPIPFAISSRDGTAVVSIRPLDLDTSSAVVHLVVYAMMDKLDQEWWSATELNKVIPSYSPTVIGTACTRDSQRQSGRLLQWNGSRDPKRWKLVPPRAQ